MLRPYQYLLCAALVLWLIGKYYWIRRRFRALARKYRAERAAKQHAQRDLKDAEAELRAFSQEIEAAICKRTEDLQQTLDCLQLVLYHAIHDLRAPLRAMGSFASLFNEQPCAELTEERKKYAERIAAASLRIDQLLQDLVHFGQLGHDRFPCERTDCNRLLSKLLGTFPEIRSGDARVVSSNLPTVNANQRLLEIVFYQLLSNALKFSKPGEQTQVHISAERQGDRATIWVQDNGIGIDPRYHQRIFKLFETLCPVPFSRSTGMGLAFARKAVQRMGGSIGVQSAANHGSRFWVQLFLDNPAEGRPSD